MTTSRRPTRAIEVRQNDSKRKHEVVRAAIAEFVSEGRPVTVAAIARAAGCSRPFIYEHHADEIANTQELQRRQGVGSGPSPTHSAAASGLHADLLLAQQEIARLRRENATLQAQLRHDLGARLEAVSDRMDDRLAGKQQEVERLLAAQREADLTIRDLRRQVQRLQDELAAERAAHTETAALLANDDVENVIPLR